MRLLLDREDLQQEYQDRNCSLIKFEHFKEDVQNVIRVVKKANFYEYDHISYNVIYPNQ